MNNRYTLEQRQAHESVIKSALSNNIRLKKESIDSFNRKPYYMSVNKEVKHENI